MAVKQNNTENGNASASSSQNSQINNQKNLDLPDILNKLEIMLCRQRDGEFGIDRILLFCRTLIIMLSKGEMPRQAAEIKVFIEDISKVQQFLAKVAEEDQNRAYLEYLMTVRDLLAQEETPSCAIAIVFELFPEDFVKKAVSLVLSSKENINDDAIKKIVVILCDWLRVCTFCQNLSLWIVLILTGLREIQKYDLLYSIAINVIDPLFRSLVLPLVRPKVAPVIFHILSSIKHTPDVFYKIVGRGPSIINHLKRELRSKTVDSIETKNMQILVDLLSALMAQFPRYDNFYEPLEAALSDLSPSNDYRSVLNYPGWSHTDNITTSTNVKVGLVNLGNTCYMNSVLQALLMTKEFSREILLSQCKAPIFTKLQQLFALMLYSSRSELTPSTVLNAIRPPGFIPGLQQDSSEFLGYILEILNEQEATTVCRTQQYDSLHSSENSTFVDGSNNDVYEEGATSSNFKENSLTHGIMKTRTATNRATTTTTTIEKTFEGKITTTYQCSTCNWQSKNIDSFRDLQLSFPEVKTDCASNYSVQDLLDYYCSSEKLNGDNQYFCEKCKKLTDAERFINIVSAPKNLILTLKHFKYDQKYHMRAKLMHKVFHDESVSLKVYSSETLKESYSVNYNLYAAVVHSGYSMDSGHYYTYASDNSDKWYKFNDNIVTSCDISELHNLNPPNTPYILFYQMNSRTSDYNSAITTNAATAAATNSTITSSTINNITVAVNNTIRVEVPTLPSIEELPAHLCEHILKDNNSYKEEKRKLNLNIANQGDFILMNKNNKRGDHDDNEPPSACGGGNTFNCTNRFVS